MTAIKQLGPVLLPQPGTAVDSRARQQTNLSETGLLSGSGVAVESTTNAAAEITLSGRLRPPIIPEGQVELIAAELDSLFNSDLGPLPLFDRAGDNSRLAGYYQIATGSVNPIQPARPEIQEWTVTLRRAGGRGSHFRAVETSRTDEFSNPFENLPANDIRIQLPDAVQTVRKLDPRTGDLSPAPRNTTRKTAGGAVGEYPVRLSSSGPGGTLVYDLPYADDVRGSFVFDTNGTDNRTDPNGNRNWQAVFDTGRDRTGDADFVLSNGLFRVFVSGEPSPRLSVEEYDPTNDVFNTVLRGTTWQPETVDLVSIGQQRVVADLRLSDGSTVYPLRFRLPFGSEAIPISPAPSASGSIPSGLETLLDPVAYEGDELLQETRDIVPKRTVR